MDEPKGHAIDQFNKHAMIPYIGDDGREMIWAGLVELAFEELKQFDFVALSFGFCAVLLGEGKVLCKGSQLTDAEFLGCLGRFL